MNRTITYIAPLALLLIAGQAFAKDVTLEIKKGGGFSPATLTVPTGEKVKLIVTNHDDVQAEFESFELKREEKINPGTTTEIFVGPLDAGQYAFFDDNNPSAKGVLVAK